MSAHGRRFGLAYLGLAVVLGAAVGTFVLLVERGAPPPPPAWSTWRPTAATPAARTNQIAAHVASRYHLPSGKRLVRVQVGDRTGKDAIGILAVAKKPKPQAETDFDTFAGSSVVMYVLCGDPKKKCAINEGPVSVERANVLRREALELALYTFRYVAGVDSIVAFFPPRPGKTPTDALFFRKDDLDEQLDRPLSATLPAKPPVAGEAKLAEVERETIHKLTTPRFRYGLQNTQGQRVLVLEPVPEPAHTTS